MQEKGAQYIQRLLAFGVLWQQIAASAHLAVGKSRYDAQQEAAPEAVLLRKGPGYGDWRFRCSLLRQDDIACAMAPSRDMV